MSHTPGPWTVYNMIHAETGERLTPTEIGEYVKNCVSVNTENTDFLFISAEKEDGPCDVCHVGNGPDGPYNARLMAAAPELLQALEILLSEAPRSECPVRAAAISIAEEAIAKARGEP